MVRQNSKFGDKVPIVKHQMKIPTSMFCIGRRYYHSLGNNVVLRRNLATHSSNSEMFWELSWVSITAKRDSIICCHHPHTKISFYFRKYAACPQGILTRLLVSSQSTGMPDEASYSGKSLFPSVIMTISEGTLSAIRSRT